jgi:hypothetical protein
MWRTRKTATAVTDNRCRIDTAKTFSQSNNEYYETRDNLGVPGKASPNIFYFFRISPHSVIGGLDFIVGHDVFVPVLTPG